MQHCFVMNDKTHEKFKYSLLAAAFRVCFSSIKISVVFQEFLFIEKFIFSMKITFQQSIIILDVTNIKLQKNKSTFVFVKCVYFLYSR